MLQTRHHPHRSQSSRTTKTATRIQIPISKRCILLCNCFGGLDCTDSAVACSISMMHSISSRKWASTPKAQRRCVPRKRSCCTDSSSSWTVFQRLDRRNPIRISNRCSKAWNRGYRKYYRFAQAPALQNTDCIAK